MLPNNNNNSNSNSNNNNNDSSNSLLNSIIINLSTSLFGSSSPPQNRSTDLDSSALTKILRKYYSIPGSLNKLSTILTEYYSEKINRKKILELNKKNLSELKERVKLDEKELSELNALSELDEKELLKLKKELSAFSLRHILETKSLNKELCREDDKDPMRFVYSPKTPFPKPDIEKAINQKERSEIILKWAHDHATAIDAKIILEWIEKNVKWRDDIKWLEDGEVLPSIYPLLNINVLSIANTFFNDDHILKLANWLRNNTTIIDLRLTSIGLDNKKAITLAEIFRTNKTIKTVELRDNGHLTEEGIKTLLKIREFNKSVEGIFIGGGPTGVNIFKAAVEKERIEYMGDKELSDKLEILNSQEPENSPVKTILNSMIRGGNEIKGNYEKFSMLFGGERAGKSIFASFLTGKQLVILNDESAGAFKIVDLQAREDNFGPIKTPTKFTGGDIIIECPGIGDTGVKSIEHIITAQYYIWQTFNNAIKPQLKLCKFLLTIDDSPNRNDIIITTLIKQFAEIFKDENENIWRENIKKLENSVSLTVTHADEKREEKHIQTILDRYIRNNEKEYHKDIGTFLKKSVNIFRKPTDNNNPISNLVNTKNLKLDFVATKEGDSYLTIIPGSLELVKQLHQQTCNNIFIIGKIILNFFNSNFANLTDPYKSSYSLNLHHPLEETAFSIYSPLLTSCLPPKPILHENHEDVGDKSYFPALKEIIQLREVAGINNGFINSVNILILYLTIIRDFFGKEKIHEKSDAEILEFKNQMNNYIHILEQQANFLIFFEKLGNGKLGDIDIINSTNLFKKISGGRDTDITIEIRETIEEMLIPAIKCIKLKPHHPVEYYQEALHWIAKYRELTNDALTNDARGKIVKKESKIHYKIGLIYVKDADEASKRKEIIEQVEKDLSQVGLGLENVVRDKKNIQELEQSLNQMMKLSLEELIEKKKLMELMEKHYGSLIELRLGNIEMMDKMIMDKENIEGIERDLNEKGLSLVNVIKQKEVIERTEQALNQMGLSLEDIIRDKNLNIDRINKYWSEAGLKFGLSINYYPERDKAYKALCDLLCKLKNEDALNYAIKYYKLINNDTGVKEAFSLLEGLFQNNLNNLKASLEKHCNILAHSFNNKGIIASGDEIERLAAECKKIALKIIDLKIRQGDYEVEKGETQPGRKDYQIATELAAEESDEGKLSDIRFKKHNSHQVDIEAGKQDNRFIKASYEKIKTAKDWDPSKINKELLKTDLQIIDNIIKEYFPYNDAAENPPPGNNNLAGNGNPPAPLAAVENPQLGGNNANAVVENRQLGGDNANAVVENRQLGGDNANAVVENRQQGGDNANAVVENPQQGGDNANAVVENPQQGGDNANAVVENPQLGGDNANAVVENPQQGGDNANAVVENPQQGGDNANAVVENPQQGGDNANAVVENPQQGGDNANAVVENPQQGGDNANAVVENPQLGGDNANAVAAENPPPVNNNLDVNGNPLAPFYVGEIEIREGDDVELVGQP
ncbi:hypothetical protein [Rickettsia endosymbiont of Aspidapion aeneum]|uniref:hypothetical protein n=1 Tax=Rickettsia endosymbiont of Aspidapion aeneum TaxID=3066247 RepID=UPI00313BFB37